jgi:hypothetical protein
MRLAMRYHFGVWSLWDLAWPVRQRDDERLSFPASGPSTYKPGVLITPGYGWLWPAIQVEI